MKAFDDDMIFRPAPYFPFLIMNSVIDYCNDHNIAIMGAEGFYRVEETGIRPDLRLITNNEKYFPMYEMWSEVVEACNRHMRQEVKEWSDLHPDLMSLTFFSEDEWEEKYQYPKQRQDILKLKRDDILNKFLLQEFSHR